MSIDALKHKLAEAKPAHPDAHKTPEPATFHPPAAAAATGAPAAGDPTQSDSFAGHMQNDDGKHHAPTMEELATNPGKFDGTAFDPTTQVVNMHLVQEYSTLGEGVSYRDWGSMYHADPHGAMSLFRSQHAGHQLNLAALTDQQKARMGKTTPPPGDSDLLA